jgi:hypothetical protein
VVTPGLSGGDRDGKMSGSRRHGYTRLETMRGGKRRAKTDSGEGNTEQASEETSQLKKK